MPRLKPEKRYDRNGKLVLRWCKDDTQASQATLPSPVPVAPVSPRASKDTMQDLEHYFVNCEISNEYPYANTLRRNVALMSETNASELVHGLWEDFNSFGNPEAVAGTLERIYGADSPIPVEHRDTVFSNLVSIIPPYGMNHDDENNDILEYTWVIFDAVQGETKYSSFDDTEQSVCQSAACVTNHIFRAPTYLIPGVSSDEPEDLSGIGFTRSGVDNTLALASTESLDALRENIDRLDTLREGLMQRKTLHPDIIREMASTGILAEGTL